MISKEVFVKIMNRLETLDRHMDDVDAALGVLSPDYGGLYIPEAISITVDTLKEVFNDEDDMLEYFVYELNYLHDYEFGYGLDENDNPADVSTWDKVYDYLTYNYDVEE